MCMKNQTKRNTHVGQLLTLKIVSYYLLSIICSQIRL